MKTFIAHSIVAQPPAIAGAVIATAPVKFAGCQASLLMPV